MTYLLDTDWLLDVIAGARGAAQTLEELRRHGLAISIVSHGELFEGAFGFPDSHERLAELYAFLSQFDTVPLSDPIMEIFGRNRSELRHAGQLIPDLDLLIAATAVSHDLTLLTRNLRHLTRVPDLQLHPLP
jgi:predicted nucleic acid-binding protein